MSDSNAPSYIAKHFELSHVEPPVHYYRPKPDFVGVRKDCLVKLDDEAWRGYVHAQSLADCFNDRVDASRFFAAPDTAYRRALRREPLFPHSLWREDIGPAHGMWLHKDLVPAFAEWVREPDREPKRFRHLAEIKDEIAAKTQGVTGVRCRAGYADVVSYPQEEVIVVEDVSEWAKGLGRLAAFSIDLRTFAKRLHLYCTVLTCREVGEDKLRLIREICLKAGVEMTLDDNVIWALEDQAPRK